MLEERAARLKQVLSQCSDHVVTQTLSLLHSVWHLLQAVKKKISEFCTVSSPSLTFPKIWRSAFLKQFFVYEVDFMKPLPPLLYPLFNETHI